MSCLRNLGRKGPRLDIYKYEPWRASRCFNCQIYLLIKSSDSMLNTRFIHLTLSRAISCDSRLQESSCAEFIRICNKLYAYMSHHWCPRTLYDSGAKETSSLHGLFTIRVRSYDPGS